MHILNYKNNAVEQLFGQYLKLLQNDFEFNHIELMNQYYDAIKNIYIKIQQGEQGKQGKQGKQSQQSQIYLYIFNMITIPLRLFIDRNDDKNIISSITKNQSTMFKMDLDMKLSRDYDTVIDDEKETIYQHLDEFNEELNIKIKSLEEKENEGFYDYKYI